MSTNHPGNVADLVAGFADLGRTTPCELDVAVLVAGLIAETGTPEDQAAGQLAAPQAIEEAFEEFARPLCDGDATSVPALLAWLRAQGFGQQPLQQATLAHSNIHWVLEHRQGLPITQAVIVLECARRCGMNGCGLNFPGHFLVRLDDARQNHLIDPLAVQLVQPDELMRDGADPIEVQRLLQPTSPTELGQRMLNNIRMLLASTRRFSQVLTVLDCQLALAGDDARISAPLQFERGEVWEQLGSIAIAREAYQQCVTLNSSRDLTGLAMDRLAALDGSSDTLH